MLETAPNIRQRYSDQASACPPDFLLKSLDIANRCDQGYKISNNKRLHLELALMQMCTLNKAAEPAREPVRAQPARQKAAVISTPAPAPAKDTVKPVAAKPSMPGTVSIKKNIPAPQAATEEPEELSSEKQSIADPFTAEQLNKLWQEFAEKVRIEKPHLFTVLNSKPPEPADNFIILVTIGNKILEEEFREIRGELTSFIRTGLNNYRIEIRTQVIENHTDLKPYTDKEKFEQMASKNPALNTLREELDLDIEY